MQIDEATLLQEVGRLHLQSIQFVGLVRAKDEEIAKLNSEIVRLNTVLSANELTRKDLNGPSEPQQATQ